MTRTTIPNSVAKTIPKKARDFLTIYGRPHWDTAESLKEALRLVRDYGFLTETKAKAFLNFVEERQYEAAAYREWKAEHGRNE